LANNFLNVSWISSEVLRLLLNMLTVAEYFNSDYEKDFKQEFAVGATVQVKFPQSFTIRDGLGYTPQGVNRISTTISLDQIFGIDFEWDDYERAVQLERSKEELRKQYFEPAAAQLAQEWDSRAAQFAYQNANNVIGVLGTDPTNVQPYYDARRRMKELACPPGGKRGMIISSSMMSSFGQNITTFFQPADELSKMFKEGSLGRAAGFDWYESNSLWSHTAGTAVTSLVISGANQSGASLVVTGTSTQTLKKGDKISVANVNQVNPRTRRIPGKTQVKNFTITQDITLSGSADTINILPAIYGPGSQYQNVDALPADAAAITLWPGTSTPSGKVGTVGLALSPYAFAKVGAKLYTPKAVEAASQEQDKDTGMAVRFVKAWDPVRSMNVHRFDTLGGFGNLYQDNGAVCVAGA
jgi:hypothetical protein